MSENGDPSDNPAYRQLGKEGNPFDDEVDEKPSEGGDKASPAEAEELEEIIELLPGGGRLEEPGPEDEGLGAPLP